MRRRLGAHLTTTFIYALNCPTTGQTRYVGKSDKPARRFQNHLTAKNKCYRANWFKSLAEQGLKPVLEILDEVPIEHWQQWEVAYIEFFNEQGCDLTNGTAGGDGSHQLSESARLKISAVHVGKKKSPEHNAKNSAAQKGEKNHRYGKSQSPESRAKIGAANRGRKRSLETRAKMSEIRRLWHQTNKTQKENI